MSTYAPRALVAQALNLEHRAAVIAAKLRTRPAVHRFAEPTVVSSQLPADVSADVERDVLLKKIGAYGLSGGDLCRASVDALRKVLAALSNDPAAQQAAAANELESAGMGAPAGGRFAERRVAMSAQRRAALLSTTSLGQAVARATAGKGGARTFAEPAAARFKTNDAQRATQLGQDRADLSAWGVMLASGPGSIDGLAGRLLDIIKAAPSEEPDGRAAAPLVSELAHRGCTVAQRFANKPILLKRILDALDQYGAKAGRAAAGHFAGYQRFNDQRPAAGGMTEARRKELLGASPAGRACLR